MLKNALANIKRTCLRVVGTNTLKNNGGRMPYRFDKLTFWHFINVYKGISNASTKNNKSDCKECKKIIEEIFGAGEFKDTSQIITNRKTNLRASRVHLKPKRLHIKAVGKYPVTSTRKLRNYRKRSPHTSLEAFNLINPAKEHENKLKVKTITVKNAKLEDIQELKTDETLLDAAKQFSSNCATKIPTVSDFHKNTQSKIDHAKTPRKIDKHACMDKLKREIDIELEKNILSQSEEFSINKYCIDKEREILKNSLLIEDRIKKEQENVLKRMNELDKPKGRDKSIKTDILETENTLDQNSKALKPEILLESKPVPTKKENPLIIITKTSTSSEPKSKVLDTSRHCKLSSKNDEKFEEEMLESNEILSVKKKNTTHLSPFAKKLLGHEPSTTQRKTVSANEITKNDCTIPSQLTKEELINDENISKTSVINANKPFYNPTDNKPPTLSKLQVDIKSSMDNITTPKAVASVIISRILGKKEIYENPLKTEQIDNEISRGKVQSTEKLLEPNQKNNKKPDKIAENIPLTIEEKIEEKTSANETSLIIKIKSKIENIFNQQSNDTIEQNKKVVDDFKQQDQLPNKLNINQSKGHKMFNKEEKVLSSTLTHSLKDKVVSLKNSISYVKDSHNIIFNDKQCEKEQGRRLETPKEFEKLKTTITNKITTSKCELSKIEQPKHLFKISPQTLYFIARHEKKMNDLMTLKENNLYSIKNGSVEDSQVSKHMIDNITSLSKVEEPLQENIFATAPESTENKSQICEKSRQNHLLAEKFTQQTKKSVLPAQAHKTVMPTSTTEQNKKWVSEVDSIRKSKTVESDKHENISNLIIEKQNVDALNYDSDDTYVSITKIDVKNGLTKTMRIDPKYNMEQKENDNEVGTNQKHSYKAYLQSAKVNGLLCNLLLQDSSKYLLQMTTLNYSWRILKTNVRHNTQCERYRNDLPIGPQLKIEQEKIHKKLNELNKKQYKIYGIETIGEILNTNKIQELGSLIENKILKSVTKNKARVKQTASSFLETMVKKKDELKESLLETDNKVKSEDLLKENNTLLKDSNEIKDPLLKKAEEKTLDINHSIESDIKVTSKDILKSDILKDQQYKIFNQKKGSIMSPNETDQIMLKDRTLHQNNHLKPESQILHLAKAMSSNDNAQSTLNENIIPIKHKPKNIEKNKFMTINNCPKITLSPKITNSTHNLNQSTKKSEIKAMFKPKKINKFSSVKASKNNQFIIISKKRANLMNVHNKMKSVSDNKLSTNILKKETNFLENNAKEKQEAVQSLQKMINDNLTNPNIHLAYDVFKERKMTMKSSVYKKSPKKCENKEFVLNETLNEYDNPIVNKQENINDIAENITEGKKPISLNKLLQEVRTMNMKEYAQFSVNAKMEKDSKNKKKP